MDCDVQNLLLADFLPPPACVHVARSTFPQSRGLALHRHDFVELFLVEAGRGWHQINGRRESVSQGDLRFIHPDDVHTLSGTRQVPMVVLNVALSQAALAPIEQQYAGSVNWPWDTPDAWRLSEQEQRRFVLRADRLADRVDSPLARDRFLLDLLDDLDAADEPRWLREIHAAEPWSGSNLPGWLTEALHVLHAQPALLTRGVEALADHCHRSREHVARVVRQELNMTATELVNRLRMHHAARALRLTDRTILDIAGDVGLPNLSHFYRLFHDHFGTTPRRYRRREQAPLRSN